MVLRKKKKTVKDVFKTCSKSKSVIPPLSIPASSKTSELVFSETGRILEARRQKLNPDSLDSFVFLRNFR